jgi:hypothetical protein
MAASIAGLFLLLVVVPDIGHITPILNIAAQLKARPDVSKIQIAGLEMSRNKAGAF